MKSGVNIQKEPCNWSFFVQFQVFCFGAVSPVNMIILVPQECVCKKKDYFFTQGSYLFLNLPVAFNKN